MERAPSDPLRTAARWRTLVWALAILAAVRLLGVAALDRGLTLGTHVPSDLLPVARLHASLRGWLDVPVAEILTGLVPKPPLYYGGAALLLAPFDLLPPLGLAAINAVALGTIVVLAHRVLGPSLPPAAGAASLALILTLPGILGLATHPGAELLHAALLLVYLDALASIEPLVLRRGRRPATRALALALGAGLLVKWNFAAFIALPAAWVGLRAVGSASPMRRTALRSLAAGHLIGLAVCGAWAASIGRRADLRSLAADEPQGDPGIAGGLVWYAHEGIGVFLGPAGSLATLLVVGAAALGGWSAWRGRARGSRRVGDVAATADWTGGVACEPRALHVGGAEGGVVDGRARGIGATAVGGAAFASERVGDDAPMGVVPCAETAADRVTANVAASPGAAAHDPPVLVGIPYLLAFVGGLLAHAAIAHRELRYLVPLAPPALLGLALVGATAWRARPLRAALAAGALLVATTTLVPGGPLSVPFDEPWGLVVWPRSDGAAVADVLDALRDARADCVQIEAARTRAAEVRVFLQTETLLRGVREGGDECGWLLENVSGPGGPPPRWGSLVPLGRASMRLQALHPDHRTLRLWRRSP